MAHPSTPDTVWEILETGWRWEPTILLGLVALGGGYAWAIGRSERNRVAPVSGGRSAAFFLGLLAILLALVSPLGELSDHYLASAHMVQHLLLTMVAVPLLLLGTPGWMLQPLLRWPATVRPARILTAPVIAYVLYNGVFLLWHLPAGYDHALQHEGLHIVEHLSFMAAAVLGWWPVLSPVLALPPLPYPARMIYLILQNLPSVLLSAILVFASAPLYPTYAEAPRIWGISALQDQQLAGLIMWVPGGLIYLLAISVVFFAWFGRERPANSQSSDIEVRL